MNLKKLFSLILVGGMCLSLAACSAGGKSHQSPRKDFEDMSDQETIEELISDYKEYDPAAYSLSYAMTTKIADTETFVSGTSSCTGKGAGLSFVESDKSGVLRSYTYTDGMFYTSEDQKKVKFSVDQDGARSLLPWYGTCFFDNVNEFANKSLLSSEDGSYFIVLSSPSEVFLKSFPAVSQADGTVGEIFMVLHFSSEGVPVGASVSYDLTVDSDGVNVSGSVRVDWSVVTADAAQISVAAPDGADSYKEKPSSSSETDDGSQPSDGE